MLAVMPLNDTATVEDVNIDTNGYVLYNKENTYTEVLIWKNIKSLMELNLY